AYTLRFRAKADVPRLLQVFGDNSKHAPVGLNQVVHLTTDWITYQTSFTAHDVLDSHNNAPQFWIGQNPGTVWLSDVSLSPGKSLPLPALAGPPSLPANVKSLVLRTFDKANATMTPEAGSIRVAVKTGTGTPWHVQAALPDLPLQAGGTYTLTYRAKADAPRSMLVVAQATGDYRNIGFNQDEALTTQWQTYTRTFRTTEVEPKPDEIQFQLAKAAGTLWLTDLTLTGTGLQPAASAPASAPELVPQEGEIMLRGLVTGTSLAQNRVFLSVTALRPFGGALVTLPAPRPKTIVVGGDAQILAPDQSPTTLDAARAGLMVTVVGKDSGVGKPLTARKMLFGAAP
ncbi:MAG: carbohydrate binding domain-containing protein, partial [Armatimonadota bacterium]|nr:carbohydrate binding domain-containing protein [Armatimonadota bacterium]